MANQTQIVCLCEGKRGGHDRNNRTSIDLIFINRLLRTLKPSWIKPIDSNFIAIHPKGGRKNLIRSVPAELKNCLDRGGKTTLMVWADVDDGQESGEDLKKLFWAEAQSQDIKAEQFDQIVFIFAKDRLENWIEFLESGATDESKEGPRVMQPRRVRDAAKKLAKLCLKHESDLHLPESLQWSCKNWRALVKRMKTN